MRTLRCLALLLLFTLPTFARDWRISDFQGTYAIDKNGGVVVIERISLVFAGAYNGIYRTIPVEYPGPRGTNYSLFLKIISVTDGQGSSLKYESKRDGAYRKLKIYIPGAEDTSKTVVITYAAPNATRFFDDHDEFYWNVTGNDWPVPIDHATAFVQLPPNANGLRAQAFTGVYGSHDQEAEAKVEGSEVRFETTNPMPMRGGLTIDVYIPKGVLEPPSALTRANWFIRSNPGVFIPFWAFLVMYLFWYYKGKDPDAGISVAPMYEPPKGMTPAEVGTLVDDNTDPRDITSTLVDLAVKGYVKIRETTNKGFLFDSKDYEFDLLKPQSEWGNSLASHERVMLQNVFGGGTTTSLSSLKNRFYTAIPVIKQDVKAQLKSKGMYLVDPDSAHALTLFAAFLVGAPFVALQWMGVVSFTDSPAVTVVGIILALIIIWIFGRNMSAKSILGGRTYVHIVGFQEFMNRVDADRLKRMPPDTFEKFLPYAMALGVERHWAQAFAGLIQNPPSWYVPYGGYTGMNFNPIYFTNSMGSMTSAAQSVFVSAPRASSSGSGFSGGGFSGGGSSGGGFGGGGGGAF